MVTGSRVRSPGEYPIGANLLPQSSSPGQASFPILLVVVLILGRFPMVGRNCRFLLPSPSFSSSSVSQWYERKHAACFSLFLLSQIHPGISEPIRNRQRRRRGRLEQRVCLPKR